MIASGQVVRVDLVLVFKNFFFFFFVFVLKNTKNKEK